MHELRTKRRIEFSDTDLAGIVHFSRFYIFMETAEHQFLNAIGTSVDAEIAGTRIGWPRLASSCDFFRPVRFEDQLDIHLQVQRKGTKSMTYRVTFECRGEPVAAGTIASVCCEIRAGERPRSIEIPEQWARRIEQAQIERTDRTVTDRTEITE